MFYVGDKVLCILNVQSQKMLAKCKQNSFTYLQNTDTEGQQLEIVKSLQVDIDFGHANKWWEKWTFKVLWPISCKSELQMQMN